MENDILKMEAEILEVIKQIYDPEIPVNIYDLGLIYEIEIDDYFNVDVTMTLTAPNCPIADSILTEVRDKVSMVKDTQRVNINLVFEPPWDKTMMSDAAKLELGFL